MGLRRRRRRADAEDPIRESGWPSRGETAPVRCFGALRRARGELSRLRPAEREMARRLRTGPFRSLGTGGGTAAPGAGQPPRGHEDARETSNVGSRPRSRPTGSCFDKPSRGEAPLTNRSSSPAEITWASPVRTAKWCSVLWLANNPKAPTDARTSSAPRLMAHLRPSRSQAFWFTPSWPGSHRRCGR